MRLFIAEKPELARAIADGLSGEIVKEKTHITKGDNIITWAFGHILELAKPETYSEKYEKWNLQDLPLNLPYPFKRIPKESSKTQLNAIVKLINDKRITELIHCGDADEEGQILIDEILEYAKTNKPVLRCLINDITPKAIQKSLQKMQNNSTFKALSESGFARSEADFIVGMNLTRLYTCLNYKNGGNGLVSIGRVQTPILGLIVYRELENKNHKSLEYFAISANFKLHTRQNTSFINAPLKLDKEVRITEPNEVNKIKESCLNQKADFSLTKENKKEYPPLPYNLLELQAECSKLYGLSPDKTLEITQNLREKHKAISYNRSDCQYLPENLYSEAPFILNCLKENFKEIEIGQSSVDLSIKSKAFDDSKLSAHYGIVPLQSKINLTALNELERNIYTLISKRFLMQFYAPCEYESYQFTFTIKDYVFQTSKRINTSLGFKEYFTNQNDKEAGEKDESFNPFLECKEALCESVESSKEKTKPRPLYTMTTLLKDLNQVSKYVSDERIKKLLLEKDKDKKGESGGIGTPATRSNHIKTLIEREYISVSNDKKQNIRATPKGMNLISVLNPLLSKPDMTALWFEKQKEIQNLTLSRKDFLQEIREFVKNIINENKESSMSVNQNNKEQIKCPKCKEGNLREIEGKFGKFFSCSRYKEGCDFKAKSINGKPDLNPKQEQTTTTYDCPLCQKGKLIRKESKNKKGTFWYGCSEWKNGCSFTCFEKDKKPNLELKG